MAQSPREEIARARSSMALVVSCPSLDAAVDAVNLIAPEHLELHCDKAFDLLGRIQNAGAIFVGPWSSSRSATTCGPNHTLPTGGTAVFSNPLGVYDFQKRSSVISYTPEGLKADGPAVRRSRRQRASAHALSVGMRRKLLAEQTERFADVSAACQDAMATAWPRKLDEPGVPNLKGGQSK